MAEGTAPAIKNVRTGERMTVADAVATASLTLDKLETSVQNAITSVSNKVDRSGDTMTGQLTVPYLFILPQASTPSEGGELVLAKSSNSSLNGDIVSDSFINRFRVFENGGDFRGAHIDLTVLTTGANSRILTSADMSGLVFLESGTITAATAKLDIILTSYTSYSSIKIFLSSFIPSTDDVELRARLSTDGGTVFTSSSYSYAATGIDSAGNNRDLASTSALFILVAGHGDATASVSATASTGGADVEIDIVNQASTARHPRVKYMSTWALPGGGGLIAEIQGTGRYPVARDTDAIRFLFESGNIASGNYSVYGYK